MIGIASMFETSLPPRTLLSAMQEMMHEARSWWRLKTLTAVSSAFLSFSSAFPPGKAVSPP